MKKIKYLLIALACLTLSKDLYAQYFIGGGLTPKSYQHNIKGNGVDHEYSLKGGGISFTTGYYFTFLRLHFDLDIVGLKKNSEKAGAIESGIYLDYYQFINENMLLYGGAGLARLSMEYKDGSSVPIKKINKAGGVIGELGFIYRLPPVDIGLAAKASIIPYEDEQKSYKSKIRSQGLFAAFVNYAF